jgi:hypothetical protein
VAQLFRSYSEAFARFDPVAISAHWAYPAYFCARGKRASLAAPEFQANAEALCAFYRAQGVARVAATVAQVDWLFDGLALARVGYELADDAGTPVAAWDHIYLVSATDGGLRLAVAMPDGELDAWAARGTPLGQW